MLNNSDNDFERNALDPQNDSATEQQNPKTDGKNMPIENENSTASAETKDSLRVDNNNGNNKKAKKPSAKFLKTILPTFVASFLIAAIITFTLAYSICRNNFEKSLAEIKKNMADQEIANGRVTELYKYVKVMDQMMSSLAYYDYDQKAALNAMLKGYAAGTGDKYATYYTQEEYEEMSKEDAGELVGIGVSAIYNSEYKAIEVVDVYEDSPALEKGLLPGDLIVSIKEDGKDITVAEIGYDVIINKIRGEEGTVVEFTVRRGKDYSEKIEFSMTRKKIVSHSVTYHVCATDAKVGIVRISQFDLTTPEQFSEAMDSLKAKGCDKFVLDVRYNPGGLLISVEAVLSYFLDEGQNIVYTENSLGNGSWSTVNVVDYKTEPYTKCNVTKEDIGKYKGLDVIVIANESTASAGELFTATLKEYGIAKFVGVNTYGKGSMQTTYSLAMYGLEGAIKMTTHLYSPMSKQNYNGVGIKPDFDVPLDEALKKINRYKITDEQDNQLQYAISVLYGTNK